MNIEIVTIEIVISNILIVIVHLRMHAQLFGFYTREGGYQ